MQPRRVLPWASLSTEMRFMILQILTQENRGLAVFASLCTEWQAILEKKKFRQLKLRSSCENDFEHMVVRQSGISWGSSNEPFIYREISKLFSFFSTWNSTDDGLTLELNAYSPSNSEHWFQNCYFGADDEDEEAIFQSSNHSQEVTANLHHPKHGWVDGPQVASP
ncbi:hypothetical protein BKA56DRAFT_611630 [Ilyonectria sp. MPI-CAGE-AT-0026]|nr:hypothetical protein BKA56DRAFT_611630 [Ilyonectria sp. MPI-CAGE-AT-0026]